MQKPVVRAPSYAFEPKYRVTAQVESRLRRIERLDHDISLLYASRRRGLTLRDAMAYNAYGTASMEGNPLTLDEVQTVLRDGATPAAMKVPDEREVLNWAQLMERLDHETVPAKVRDVEALHGKLFSGVIGPRRGLGRIKDRPNYIGLPDGTAVYVPTTPARVAAELQTALDWYHEAPDPPLVKAWLFHAEFEGIHPFIDGNGRIGRALMTLMLHRSGYPGVRYVLVDYAINRDRQDYYDALQEAARDPDDLTPWLGYASAIFEASYVDAVARLTVQDAADLNPRQARVAAWLLRVDRGGRRVAFGEVHGAFPHINRRTLQEDLKRLVDAGFLDLKGIKRGATYGVVRRSDDERAET